MEVKDLVTRFHTEEGVVHAVNGVSYTLQEGETLGVVGESGCGKSVHALSVMGLIPQPPGEIPKGEVIFRERDLLKLNKNQQRLVRGAEIAMVFQDPMTSLNPVLTVGRQITEALKLHLGMDTEQARARAAELLELVGIPSARERLDDYPHQFSGGMRQRAMIAMGLSCNPQLLIADEPTTALDVTIQAQILDLVRRLRDKIGMAIIWISHDLGVVAGLADNVNVMYAGYIVERGSSKAVYGDSRHPYTVGLLGSLPRLDQKNQELFSIKGSPPDMRFLPKGCPFEVRCPWAREQCRAENTPLQQVPDGPPDHVMACWVDIREEEGGYELA
ncbi:MAG: ABC transporter ATP-binding protein [Anaerolineae bacterium]|nr:ABC transporter ATP-binding protein [Anaerolineae bacterium]